MKAFQIVFLTTIALASMGNALLAGTGWNDSFQETLAGTTRLRVRSTGDEGKTLADINDAKEISAMLSHIRLNEEDEGKYATTIMCCGDTTFEFYSNDKLIATFEFFPGLALRWLNGKWGSDVFLTGESATFLVEWLAEHGVSGPKEKVEQARQEAIKYEANRQRWLDAKPESLRPFKEKGIGVEYPAEVKPMQTALAKEYPDKRQQILALLAWFGSGAGPWSGFPAYEEYAEQMLLLYSTEDIIEVLQKTQLTEAQTEGAARLLGGWTFSQKRPADLAKVPETIKQQLLAHSMKSDDKDKKGRAVHAFSPSENSVKPAQ